MNKYFRSLILGFFLIMVIPAFSQDVKALSEAMVFRDDMDASFTSFRYFMSLIKDQELSSEDILKENGVAISPVRAADCMLDPVRTNAFVQSLYQATQNLEKDTVNILYVGCGPLAPFMTLTAPLLPHARYSLVEISENAAKTAQLLINRLNLQQQLDTLIIADATEMVVPNNNIFDIIITETMDAGLNTEMMIPILIHILPQLKKEVILIPEEVSLELILMNQQHQLERQPIFTATELLNCYFEEQSFPRVSFPAVGKSEDKVFVGTQIKVFGDIQLDLDDSVLTRAIPIKTNPSKPMVFSYCITPPQLLINDKTCDP